jgi:hypothetical protein
MEKGWRIFVIPAKAGIHEHRMPPIPLSVFMGPGLRRDDGPYFLALKSSEALLMQ